MTKVAAGTTNPATGAPLDPVPYTDPADVATAVAHARAAQAAWAALPFAQRADRVREVGRRILERRDEICALLGQEMGRSATDSLFSEVVFAVSYTSGAVKVAKEALAPRTVRLSPLDFPGKSAVIEAVPRGVIGIIEPWNYPLLQFYKPLFPALLAGNTVVLKPSEHAPRTGMWLHRLCQEVLPQGVVQCVVGAGDVGSALVEAEIDALVFCGSVATGRKVAARCAERLLPCSVELGGKDAAIVLSDCDLPRTVAGVMQWSMHNAGQDCSSIERVYVEQSIADAFVDQLANAVGRLRVAPEPDAEVGPLQNAAQLQIVARHVQQAVDAGAVVRCGGAPTGNGHGFQPTVLDRCTDEMEVVMHETFGPVVAIVRVADEAEAVRRANAGLYGLCGSVWTRDISRGERVARQLDVGIALVNNHSFPGSIPAIPWTGTKLTGTGTAASVFAYETFVRRRTIIVDRSAKPDIFWKPSNAELAKLGSGVAELALGRLGSVLTVLPLLGKRVAAIRAFVAGK